MALWGGRFSKVPGEAMFSLSRSVHFDWRLSLYDLRSSLAHLNALEANSIIDRSLASRIRSAIGELQREVASGKFAPITSDEDVHSALERGLIEKVGPEGGAIRAGRSRNDQVATDFRLYLIDHMIEIALETLKLSSAITDLASQYVSDVAPGFTHLQHAQPVSFGHELAKHAQSLSRDISRISDWLKRSKLSPLGAGALAGSSLPLSVEASATELGFTGVIANSIDAVSDRDFVAEALFIISLIGVHLSRIGEEWSLYASIEFGWVELDDAYATGSSIMPQKKNPDAAELARGKSGRFIGSLTALLTVIKGLPFAYNRDLQEDKELTFDAVENLLLLLPAITGMVASSKFNREKMRASAPLGFSLATEIADFLVLKGVAFPGAHEAAGKAVKRCEELAIELVQLSDSDLKAISPLLTGEVRNRLNLDSALKVRDSINGTAPESVKKQIANLRVRISADARAYASERKRFSGMMDQ
ncbi:MAG: argininosuccinate lyase [Actinobacteria bacterium]|nr:argininosuccinate lyase [Actinomycetota bacterium]